ncbi:MAG: RloB domain-containing protein [Candidatus Ornithospirochaeta sp.]
MTIRKKNKVEAKPAMLMVCATDAEVVFFSQFRKDCRYSNLTVVKASANTLDKLISESGSLRTKGKYSSVWCVFGLDEVNATLEEVGEAKEKADKKKVKMLYFAPSFELYFALFATSPKRIADKNTLLLAVKANFPDFELSPRYFLTDGINLNFKIYPRLAVADQNARTYNALSLLETGFDATTLPDFLEDLKETCGSADMSQARNRF